MVAADGAGHAGAHCDDHQLRIRSLEAGNDDRDQDTESTPGSAGRKGQAYGDQEDDGGQEGCEARCVVGDDARNEFLGAQAGGRAVQGPCQGQDQDGGYHLLEAVRQASHHFFKGQGVADQVINHGDDQGAERAQYQSDGSITAGKGIDEIGAAEESAGVDHADDTADDQREDRDQHIRNDPMMSMRFVFRICVRAVRCGIDITLLSSIVFMQRHRSVVDVHEDDHDHHGDGQQCIVVVRNGFDKECETVFALHKSGDCSSPAGDGCDDADGGGGGINQVCQLCSGDFVFVCHGAHDAADRQAVEIIVDEDQDAQADGGQLRTLAGLNAAGCPVSEGSTSAGAVHELNDGSQNDQEDQNTDIPGIRQRGDDSVVEDMSHRTFKVKARIQKRAGQDTNEQ